MATSTRFIKAIGERIARKTRRFWLADGLVLSIAFGTEANCSEKLPVDLLLVLANDTFGNVYQDDLVSTRNAYRAAMIHPSVLHAVQSGPFKRIAVAYVEWSAKRIRRCSLTG